MKIIHTESAPAAVGPYSQAVISGGMVYTAGQIALSPATGALAGDTVEAQTEQVMANLCAVLTAAGSSFEKAVKTTCFLADMGDFAVVNGIYEKLLGGAKPARSAVQVAALPKGARIEIELVAEI